MKKETFGEMIAALRKEQGMTQLELAEKMGVTDKAVSKWERDLSFPDVASLPKLAGIFGLSVDALIQAKGETREGAEAHKVPEIVNLILKAVALAMGVAVAVLTFLKAVDAADAAGLLGIGLAALAAAQFTGRD